MSAFNCPSTNCSVDYNSEAVGALPRKRREDACALQNFAKTEMVFSSISHDVLSECDRVLASLLLLQVIRGVSIDIVRY